eukprot:TRINITY_DN9951_c0_g1_i3.p1 TRINITY_DN9951_c0_g1~~TRINITY_DN9951_c0_g1_i3.p1  ORF type:complete len:253 (-),score=47.22 TRINITY_DN9951_c0_g1_i3:14-772(-)
MCIRDRVSTQSTWDRRLDFRRHQPPERRQGRPGPLCQHRVNLFSAVTDFLKPAPPPDPSLQKALGRVAELVDPMLKLAPGFEKKLNGPLQHALGYCAGLVASLPGPIDINRQAFANDPLVHALFATADDIDQMLGRSQAVRDFLSEPCSWESDHFYAMFAARRQQKKQLGMEQQGDVIRNDVPQLKSQTLEAVSYTHLTLPTICSVQISVVAVSLKKKNRKEKDEPGNLPNTTTSSRQTKHPAAYRQKCMSI